MPVLPRSPKIAVSEAAMTDRVFTSKEAPTRLHLKARLLSSWAAIEGVAATLAEGLVEGSEHDETIRLIPYAAAKLRITSFPGLKE
jgi:hypothetical protein